MKVQIRHPRYRGRWVAAGVVAATGGAVWAAIHWWPRHMRPGWAGTEQAVMVADLVAALAGILGLVVAAAAWLRPRSPHPGLSPRRRGPQVVGRVPPPAAWFQPRDVGERLAQATGRGRTAVLTQVVSGMGGVGKTQLAANFARTLVERGEVELLVWITASGRDAIVAGYAEAAVALGLAGPDVDPQPAAQRFLVWAEQTDRRWLVVLDDLVTPADVSGSWPPTAGDKGRMVVITRRRDAALAGEGRMVVDVGLFTETEAGRYLAQALPGHQPAELDRLAFDLGYLPLALAQAAVYIRDRRLSCEEYRTRFSDQRRKLLDLLPEEDALPDEQQLTVAATWRLSLEAANQLNPEGTAGPVLDLASCLDPNGIPTGVFTARPALAYVTTVAGRPTTADDVGDALHNLERVNLLTVTSDLSDVRVHALIQRATRESFADQGIAQVAYTVADALAEIWPAVERDSGQSQLLRSNTTIVYRHGGDSLLTPGTHPVLLRSIMSLGTSGNPAEAAAATEQLLADVLRVHGRDHPDTLTIRGTLTRWRGAAGDPAGAADALEQLLADTLRVLGPDHPDTLITRGNLARWRGEAGDPTGAAVATEQLLADRLRVLGADHPDTLTSRHNLARLQGAAGDPAEAVTALQKVMVDAVRVLGPDHPDTLAIRHTLAYSRGEAGDPTEAVTALQHLLVDAVRVLGPDHPDTLTARHTLAYWQGMAGDPNGAVAALRQLLADLVRVLGPDHLDVLTTRKNLTYWQDRAGRS